MNILIDNSVWIDYFRGGENSEILNSFIDENILCTNHLILSELIPILHYNGHFKLIKLLREIKKIPLTINWEVVIKYQTICLLNGIKKVGIPDLIIIDNVIQNDIVLYTFDKHFDLMSKHINFKSFLP